MIYPSLSQAKALSEGYDLVPVAYEMLADTHTPINLFLSMKETESSCFLLESVDNGEQWGRYSFIGMDSKAEIKIKDFVVTVKENNMKIQQRIDNPIQYITDYLNQYKSPKVENIPKLSGGLVGYFAYDTVRYMEKKLVNAPEDDLEMPDSHFMVCNEIIAFDHFRQRLLIIVNVPVNGDFDKNYSEATLRAGEIAQKIKMAVPKHKPKQTTGELSFSSNLTKEKFIENVEIAKEHIRKGDIFQVVLSQRFVAENAPDSFDVYRMLRATNPSPYLYYFKFSNYHIAGASPEMLVSVEDGTISTRPIAGTIKRGKTEKEDKELENLLISDLKERAEHTMLVDLGRNDVGKVSRFGSVEVTSFMQVEKYSQVMHLVSDVKGKLSEHKTGLDALMAVLPAGTLSGAPKVRAMEIIDELENEKRGLYGGTVGYISFDGDIDTCIAIRTVLFKDNKAYVQAGAGIVADSVPEREFEETENKAKAMLKAIEEARGI
ncbi:MAG: anthranilate synthase component I [Clostridiales bacterium 43-6]|nr:MAG: anthranilate synthase component I [Clostridiales bacterium 43-6]